MTELSHVHGLVQALGDGDLRKGGGGFDLGDGDLRKGGGGFDLVQLFRLVMDQIVPHLEISTIGMMGRTCKSLRGMTSNETFLNYMLRLLPHSNSLQTRRRFLIPRSMPLHRITRGFYSQPHSLLLAIDKYGGMKGFRTAVEKRRIVTTTRRNMANVRFAQREAGRMRRLDMVTDAMKVLCLPPNTRYKYPLTMLFVNNVPPVPQEMETYRIIRIVEGMCWLHYLTTYTDFHEACDNRREIMGDYPGLVRDVVEDYDRPTKWPWLA